MKVCPYCQATIQAGATACWKCGKNPKRSWLRRITDSLSATTAERNRAETSEEAIAKLIGSLEDEGEGVRRNAAVSLARIAQQDPVAVREAIPKLIRLLEDENSHIRGFAVRALGAAGAGDALGPLNGLLDDDAGSGLSVGGSFNARELTVGEIAQDAIERIERQ